MILSDMQIENMRHALGLTNAKQPYRNHYCACPDDKITCGSWDELVAAGYATAYEPMEWLPYRTYRVTDSGREALLAVNTKIIVEANQ